MNYSEYKCLNRRVFQNQEYKLVPIRFEDRYKIMEWRNDQIYHLRQEKLLTKNDQDKYFKKVILNEFNEENPNQILFSLLKKNICIAYGGIVHINWKDKNGEISFVINTKLEKNNFNSIWSVYLAFIEGVAFKELGLKKIFVYAFDLRPHLYPVLEKNGFNFEAKLKKHVKIGEHYKDIIIHSKFNQNE